MSSSSFTPTPQLQVHLPTHFPHLGILKFQSFLQPKSYFHDYNTNSTNTSVKVRAVQSPSPPPMVLDAPGDDILAEMLNEQLRRGKRVSGYGNGYGSGGSSGRFLVEVPPWLRESEKEKEKEIVKGGTSEDDFVAGLLNGKLSEGSLVNEGSSDDPPWLKEVFSEKEGLFGENEEEERLEREKKRVLRGRQVEAETSMWEHKVREFRMFVSEMRKKKLAPHLPPVKKLFLDWFEPLKMAIEDDQEKEKERATMPHCFRELFVLPADKMAVIVMHKTMSMLLQNPENYVRVVDLSLDVGKAIDVEARIHNYLEKTKKLRKKSSGMSEELIKEKENRRNRVKTYIKRKRLFQASRLVSSESDEPWSYEVQAKVGCRLIDLLLQTACVQYPGEESVDGPPDIRPAFKQILKIFPSKANQEPKQYGVIECDPLVLKGVDYCSDRWISTAYNPMLIPPHDWKGYDKGGYLVLPSYVMRSASKKQVKLIRNAPPGKMNIVYEALNTLGNTKWRINKRVLNVVESLWGAGGNIARLIDREDIPLPVKPLTKDPEELSTWRRNCYRANKVNRERHSLRCDTELVLQIAQTLRDEEEFYYPHNLDFRGRAYPMHPYLNHLNRDLCRGILEFAEGRPLGESGLRWLKIHLASLYGGGVDKLSLEDRIAFVENHLTDIFDSARNPIYGKRWWLNAEDPFQCLAACTDLSNALNSSSPHTVISYLPVHQDGSCNGLQHYAALGRSSQEAEAVNLVAGRKPADVYSEIAGRVHEIMEEDSRKDPSLEPNALLAKVLVDQVDRKLVKQTVMTSVYGVTMIGAREQISKRLKERDLDTDDDFVFAASCYAAKVTMSALGQLFQSAREIMDWLSDCAKIIAARNEPVCWTTPLGLPVVQPYYRKKRNEITTTLQVLSLHRLSEKIDVKKQRTAFPPNYVHSLDGTHMMMTAVACRDAGLQFAGVHDSFWTHACDVDTMNQILRQKFVELYRQPILEQLLESFQESYPELTFPPLPERGDFSLEEVLESAYFFN